MDSTGSVGVPNVLRHRHPKFCRLRGYRSYLGGDAVNGKIEDGRYYLFGVRSNAGQKVYTEVSEPVFNYSKWHVYSVWVTWPLVMAAGYAANRKRLVRS